MVYDFGSHRISKHTSNYDTNFAIASIQASVTQKLIVNFSYTYHVVDMHRYNLEVVEKSIQSILFFLQIIVEIEL